MPADLAHEAFPQPSNPDGRLWRYMDLPRLIAMLAKRELHLTKLSELADPFEGKIPPRVLVGISNQSSHDCFPARFSEIMRQSTYVSCWCKQEHESEALWRIYGRDTGVAIRTRYSRLAASLPSSTPWGSVFMGRVLYRNPDENHPPMLNALELPMWKRHFFEHEQECRVVVWGTGESNDSGAIQHGLADGPPGIAIPIDVVRVIEDVVTSPFAPKWFHDCVIAVLDRFEPRIPIACSSMLS